MNQSQKEQTPVITGMGCISPLGRGIDEQIAAIAADRVGIDAFGTMEQAEAVKQEPLRGGECSSLDGVPIHERAARGLAIAVREALDHASFDPENPPYSPERIAVVFGTSLHGMNAAGAWLRGQPAEIFKWFLAGQVLEHALEGLPIGGARATCSSACASAFSSVGHARTLLETGAADMVLCGGYDPISEYSVAGFHSLRVVSLDRLRPFAKDRQGMQVSEGYAVFVLEREADARKRGRSIHAVISGIGESSDAHHLTQPHPEGLGAAAVLADAMQDAGLSAESIGLIVAHATGTRDNDAAEAKAFQHVFGGNGPKVAALKSRIGHTLGAAGALEACITRACLDAGWQPTTANVAADQVGEPVNLAIDAPYKIEQAPDHLVSCSLGFGGANAAVIQTSPDAIGTVIDRPQPPAHRVGIVGLGAVLPSGLCAGLPNPDDLWQHGTVDPAALKPYLPRAKARRLSPLSKLALTATQLAFKDAGIDPHELPGLDAAPSERPACLVASANGTASYAYDYYRELVEQGYKAANPLMFAEGVPNAPAAHVSMFHKLHGTSQTIIGTHTSGLDALSLAILRIASGRWRTAVVCLAEEDHPLLREIMHACGCIEKDASPFEGAIALVLQRVVPGEDVLAELSSPLMKSSTQPEKSLGALYGDGGPTPMMSPTDIRHQAALREAGHPTLPYGTWFGLGAGLSLIHAMTRPQTSECRIAAGCPSGLVSSIIMSR
jgi:3-oxoacyl-[acyl-carrier-protein] synthase II